MQREAASLSDKSSLESSRQSSLAKDAERFIWEGVVSPACRIRASISFARCLTSPGLLLRSPTLRLLELWGRLQHREMSRRSTFAACRLVEEPAPPWHGAWLLSLNGRLPAPAVPHSVVGSSSVLVLCSVTPSRWITQGNAERSGLAEGVQEG